MDNMENNETGFTPIPHIEAPFTPQQVENLNKYQMETWFHPFTCGSPGDIPECKRAQSRDKRVTGEVVEYNDENEGLLKATEQGWVCPCGKYTQNWAHAFMAE